MMEQESKEVQRGQEKSWRDLTAEEMAALMLDMMKDEENHKAWRALKSRVEVKDKSTRARNGKVNIPYSLNGQVCGLLIYFFSFIAAMKEKTHKKQLQDTSDAVDELGEKYHLDAFCRGIIKESDDFEFYFYQIVPGGNYPIPEARKAACWKRILKYLESVPSTRDTVIKVFEWLREKNNDASRYGASKSEKPSENDMCYERDNDSDRSRDSYRNCLELLDEWWQEKGEFLLDRLYLEGNPFAKEVKERIKRGVKQVIFTGAPGTGKTYTAKLISKRMGTRLPGDSDPHTLVQFHPSYDYTDFVEGLRPVEGKDKKPVFVKLDGQFKAFCRRVVEEGDPAKKYFFLIDEINRAELSKVFGELMFCLEADKRGETVQTQYQNLPTYDLKKACDLTPEEDVFHGGFFIPDNVIVIGTMNDIDRSVESMDFALRRRFEWKEAVVDKTMLEKAFEHILKDMSEGDRDNLVKNIVKLNNVIVSKECQRYGLTRQHFISQGQFANLPDLTKELTDGEDKDVEADKSTKTLVKTIKDYVWNFRLESLLREYLRGEAEKDIDEFIAKCKVAFFDVV